MAKKHMSKVAVYYIILALIVMGKAGHTLYQRSLVVHHGFSVAEYQATQRTLATEKIKLQAELSSRLSLTKTQQSEKLASYAPIKNTMVINTAKNLASLE